MRFERNVGGPDRAVRAALAVVLAAVAVLAVRAGDATLGLLAGVGAVSLGFNAVTCFCGVNRVLGIDTTGE